VSQETGSDLLMLAAGYFDYLELVWYVCLPDTVDPRGVKGK